MNNDKLIELITKEVMKRIKLVMEVNNTNNKKILVLESSADLCPIVKKNLAENEISVDSIDNMTDTDEYEFILIQKLSNNELINISQGYASSSKEKTIIDILLKGKKVYALEKGLEYKEHENIAPKALLEVFQNHKSKLVSFGIEFTSVKGLLANNNNNSDNRDKTLEKQKVKEVCQTQKVEGNKYLPKTLGKKLISEMDIKHLQKEGVSEVIVSKKSIVTPLAKDFARVNNITIKVQS